MSAPNYPATMVMRARELHAAGWSLERVADLVGDETGSRPHKSTVYRWVNPAADEAGRESARRWQRRQVSAIGAATGGRLGCVHHTAPYQEARCRALLGAGVRPGQAALVMAFDYPDQGWTLGRARRLNTTQQAVAA